MTQEDYEKLLEFFEPLITIDKKDKKKHEEEY